MVENTMFALDSKVAVIKWNKVLIKGFHIDTIIKEQFSTVGR